MPEPWAITGGSTVFVTLAIMAFFGCCCCPCTWLGGKQELDNTDDRSDKAHGDAPHFVDFRAINYHETEQGPAPTTDADAASSADSRVSSRTASTFADEGVQSASSSVYSRPTHSVAPSSARATPAGSVCSNRQGSSTVEVVEASTGSAGTGEDDGDVERL